MSAVIDVYSTAKHKLQGEITILIEQEMVKCYGVTYNGILFKAPFLVHISGSADDWLFLSCYRVLFPNKV